MILPGVFHVQDTASSNDARLPQIFCLRLGHPPDSIQVGVIAEEVWFQISVALEPIFGSGGVSALFARSVFLSARHFPTLEAIPDTMSLPSQLLALRTFLSTLEIADAINVATTLVREFHGVLTSVVGTALTDQILKAVLDAQTPPYPHTGHIR